MKKQILRSMFVLLGMVLACTSVLAAPVYLSCAFPHPSGKPQIFNFMLDKAAGTFGVYVPASGSERMEKGVFTAQTASLNEGTVAWNIDLARQRVVREKRMIGEKDSAACKTVSRKQSGFGS